jgi:hypothetical protein
MIVDLGPEEYGECPKTLFLQKSLKKEKISLDERKPLKLLSSLIPVSCI